MKDIVIKDFATGLHFKRITADKLRQSPSFNLVDEEGKFVAVVVVPASFEKREQIQALCGQMNVALGAKE